MLIAAKCTVALYYRDRKTSSLVLLSNVAFHWIGSLGFGILENGANLENGTAASYHLLIYLRQLFQS